ncbi:MAG: hypothetical protein JWO77_2198 [Ilumatobacteraceae bacterium]|nr:hypothetical protein [Ilumatobacteraceae bacterium]
MRLVYQEAALQPWFDALADPLPGLAIHDGHLHLGTTDPAGYQAQEAEVVSSLERIGARGVVFPVQDPAGYRRSNAEVAEVAARNAGRLTAFARLDPADDPVAEARRGLERGVTGLKLHPRGEGFELDDRRLDDVFALADDLRLPVLIHAGVGHRSVGGHALDRAKAHPGARLVLAHVAVGAFTDVVPDLADVPNLLVDTSWWNPSDLWAAFRLIPPGQIVHGSDVPFNSPVQGALMSARLGLQAGLSPDQVRAVMGGTLGRLLAGEDLPDLGPVDPDEAPLAPELERVYVTVCSAVVPMLAGDDGSEGLELARAACQAPQGPHRSVLENVDALLEAAQACESLDPLRPLRAPGFDLVLTAALVARTPDVVNPELP